MTANVSGRFPNLVAALVAFAAIVIIGIGLGMAASFVGLVALSIITAIVCRPLQLELLRRGLPGWAALTITIVLLVLVLLSLVVAGAGSVYALADRLPTYAERLQDILDEVAGLVTGVTGGDGDFNDLPGLDAGALLGTAAGILRSAAGGVTTVALAVLVVTYLLIDAPRLRSRMLAATSDDTVARFDALARELFTYVRVRAILGGAAAIANTILLLVLGVPFALLWGLISFLFSFVPNLGFIIALVPPALIALLEVGPLPAVGVVVGYVAINLAFDYVVQPRFLGAELDLSPVIVVLAIIAWAALLGPLGALLAVPMTIALRALLLPFPAAAWFVAILGGSGSARRHVAEERQEMQGEWAASGAGAASGGAGAPSGAEPPPTIER